MSLAVILLALRVLLALALYAFLAVILVALWREMRGAPSAANLTPAAHLVVESDSLLGQTFDLAASNLLGRSPENGVSLRDATISAYHARLTYQGAQWLLEDLGSRNGTMVNGIPVESPMVVTYGDLLTVGSISLRLVAGADEEDRSQVVVATHAAPGWPGAGRAATEDASPEEGGRV
jgi:hypothetical protein